MSEVEIGVVAHYFNHIEVGAINITEDELSVGDTIHIQGHTSDFTMTVDSMQVEHESVQTVKAGESVGIKVPERVHEHDKVLKVRE